MLHYYKPITKAKEILGEWTIGWGMRFYPDGRKVKMNDRITAEEANSMYEYAMVRFEQATLKALRRPVQQHEFDALVSLVSTAPGGSFFYVSHETGCMRSPALIRRINASSKIGENYLPTRQLWEELWVPKPNTYRDNSIRVYRIMQARCTEAHLFLTGELKLLKLVY